ncbi:MAG TPA: CpaF family protein [Acidimicrobiales bacterium]|nr:CpaF family protein [Acidimicrobiales bacterium]
MKLSEKLASVQAEVSPTEPATRSRPRPAAAGSGTSATRRSPDQWESSKRRVHELVLVELGASAGDLAGAELEDAVRKALDRILSRKDLGISPAGRRRFVQEVIQDILGYGVLEPLLADPAVTEVMCNNYDEIWVERAGRTERMPVSFASPEQYRRVIDRIVTVVGRRVDESSPMVDARLADGSRVNAIVPPLAIRGPVLTIRKFPADPMRIHDLINLGALGMDAAEFLEACVRARINILVSGATATGKTTLLNVLSSFIPDGERVITIEDAAELQLQQPHVVSLEARPPNSEGAGEVRIRDLVKNSLRMRPDRIIVGECRGAEALDMLQAMHTGHEGSMTTVHANDPRDALSRLETMILMAGFELPLKAIRDQVVSGLELIIHLARTAESGRRVVNITEVQGLEGDVVLLQDLFVRPESAAELSPTGLRPRILSRLAARGVEVRASLFRNEAVLAELVSSGVGGRVPAARRPGRVEAPGRGQFRPGHRR